MDMKISALLLLLLAATWTASQGESFRKHRSKCCSKFSNGKIPDFKIKDYKDPDPNCSLKAALVKLPKGIWTCVNPEAKWLQAYLRKQKKTNSTSK